MASRRFFGYDPYDYYYPASYHYPSPYHSHHEQPAPARRTGGFYYPAAADADQYYGFQHEPAISRSAGGFFPETGNVDSYYHHPAPARRAGGIFPAAGNVEPAAAARAAVRPKATASRSVSSIPVRFVASGPEPETAMVPVKRAPSAEEAAVRIQAAARGFLARRAVRALRAVEREAEEIGGEVAREAAALRGEQLMRLLLRLDAVRGAREYRKRVARRVLALQDAVDALEQQRPAAVAEEAETTTGETVPEGNAVAAEQPEDGESNGVTGETAVEMEVDGGRGVAGETEPAVGDGANLGGDKPAVEEDAEGEWEVVAEEHASTAPAAPHAPPTQEPAAEETTMPAEETGGLDAKKLMEMVAALCEQSTQQCAAIGALAERVDALERAVRRVEDAERRRRRAKKLRKEGRGSNRIKCYNSD